MTGDKARCAWEPRTVSPGNPSLCKHSGGNGVRWCKLAVHLEGQLILLHINNKMGIFSLRQGHLVPLWGLSCESQRHALGGMMKTPLLHPPERRTWLLLWEMEGGPGRACHPSRVSGLPHVHVVVLSGDLHPQFQLDSFHSVRSLSSIRLFVTP